MVRFLILHRVEVVPDYRYCRCGLRRKLFASLLRTQLVVLAALTDAFGLRSVANTTSFALRFTSFTDAWRFAGLTAERSEQAWVEAPG